ncbi:MAG: hypothetical protein N3A66_03725 [Planctomycetota bacterium]|nr:hypothetical protein [Planctomycetota bacterium]
MPCAGEDLLMRERLNFWRRARKAHEAGRYAEAIAAYREALACAARDERTMEQDVGRADIQAALIQCRLDWLAALKAKYPTPNLVHMDKGGIAWHFFPRPENLRRMTRPILFTDLRLDVESYFGRWLAVRGVYAGAAEYHCPLAAAVQLAPEKHPELAVVAYTSAARALHQEMAASRKDDLYLRDLLREGAPYPYDEAAAALESAAVGSEIICYGRLLKRNEAIPPYVFEVWAVEAVPDPDAARLAECLKKTLRCDFEETPLAKALEFIEMVSQVHCEFEGGETPEVSLNLSIAGMPAGAVVDKIAAELGLKWTRRGANVLFVKRDLTPAEATLQRQVLRLATDTKADKNK